MRRVFENDLNLIRIYRSNQMMDATHSVLSVDNRVSRKKQEEELDFFQMLNKEIRALSVS